LVEQARFWVSAGHIGNATDDTPFDFSQHDFASTREVRHATNVRGHRRPVGVLVLEFRERGEGNAVQRWRISGSIVADVGVYHGFPRRTEA
jgi:hypothetical protein